jgi:hypothetical protein
MKLILVQTMERDGQKWYAYMNQEKKIICISLTDSAFGGEAKSREPYFRKNWKKVINAFISKGLKQHDFKGGFDEAIKELEI